MTIHTLTDLDTYLRFQQNVLHRSPHTLKAYRRLLEAYAAYLTSCGTCARSCNACHVAGFFAELTGQNHYAARSIRQNMSILSSFHAWLQNMEYRTSNPVALLARPGKPQDRPPPPTDAEILAMRAAIVQTDRAAAFALLADCGLRSAEAVSVTIESIDLAARTISVLGKGRKRRTVHIRTSAGVEAIARQIGTRSHGYLLPSSPGRARPHIHPANLNRWLIEAARAARLHTPERFYPHALRHYLADRMHRDGHAVLTIQHQLGHSSPEVTAEYVHHTAQAQPADLAAARKTLARVLDQL